MSERDFSVLIVGLDGATFDLMLPWIDEGCLPNLARLLREGAHSKLESTIPPITPCAWSSFITGKNPGKHGLFDFVQPNTDDHGFRFTNASFRDGESLWGCLNRHDRQVGVVNVPMTYPPEPVDGFMISGLDTPHERSPYMHPTHIRDELKAASIRYRIDQQHLGNMRTDARRQQQLADIFAAETARTETLRLLSRRYPSDFRMIVYGATDQVQHHFWHYMDSDHDKHDFEGASKFRHAIRDTYRHVDELLGTLLEECDENTIVIVMSDHGFGPTSGLRLRFNQILEASGLLKFQSGKAKGWLRRKSAGWVDGLLRSTLSSDMKRTLAGMLPRLRVWFENLDEAGVEWEKTQAYVNEAYRSSPAVWINRQNGMSRKTADQVSDDVETIVKALVDPQTGQPAVSNVYRTRDLYHGPHTEQAPELLPSWWEDGFLIEQSHPNGNPETQIERCNEPIRGGVEFAGSHRLDGVFMIHGGPVRQNLEFADARIIDIAPTVLYLMGVPIPDDMDGRVLTECLDEDYVATHPVAQESAVACEGEHEQSFTEDESELIARRLQALGYIK